MKKTKIKKFNCCPKLNNPVDIPTRKEVLEIMEELRDEIVNQFLTTDELVGKYGMFIGTRFNVDVKHAASAQVEPNDIELNGYYDGGLDEFGDIPIELYLITNPMLEISLIDNKQFDLISRKIADTLSHEVIHMKQYRARDFLEVETVGYSDYEDEDEDEENRYYLSSPDEINAYAYNIANELLDHHSFPVALEKLNRLSAIEIADSVNLWAYVQAFEKDVNHPVIRKLVKQVYKSVVDLSKKH